MIKFGAVLRCDFPECDTSVFVPDRNCPVVPPKDWFNVIGRDYCEKHVQIIRARRPGETGSVIEEVRS